MKNNAVEIAVEPLRNDALSAAKKHAEIVIQNVRNLLENANWDLNQVAPKPKMSSANYRVMATKRNLILSMVDRPSMPSQGRVNNMSEPYIVTMNEELCDRYIQQVVDMADAQYTAFISKLTIKVGDCVEAALAGNHVWDHSILTVTSSTGEITRWKTQQIYNRSSKGLVFPQWPTKKVK